VVHGLAPASGRFDGYLKVFLRLVLADELGQRAGPQAVIERRVVRVLLAGYDTCYGRTPCLTKA
jgi:hypothetical protein